MRWLWPVMLVACTRPEPPPPPLTLHVEGPTGCAFGVVVGPAPTQFYEGATPWTRRSPWQRPTAVYPLTMDASPRLSGCALRCEIRRGAVVLGRHRPGPEGRCSTAWTPP